MLSGVVESVGWAPDGRHCIRVSSASSCLCSPLLYVTQDNGVAGQVGSGVEGCDGGGVGTGGMSSLASRTKSSMKSSVPGKTPVPYWA